MGIKLHTLLDLPGSVPDLFARAYVDSQRLDRLPEAHAIFVTRAKRELMWRPRSSHLSSVGMVATYGHIGVALHHAKEERLDPPQCRSAPVPRLHGSANFTVVVCTHPWRPDQWVSLMPKATRVPLGTPKVKHLKYGLISAKGLQFQRWYLHPQ